VTPKGLGSAFRSHVRHIRRMYGTCWTTLQFLHSTGIGSVNFLQVHRDFSLTPPHTHTRARTHIMGVTKACYVLFRAKLNLEIHNKIFRSVHGLFHSFETTHCFKMKQKSIYWSSHAISTEFQRSLYFVRDHFSEVLEIKTNFWSQPSMQVRVVNDTKVDNSALIDYTCSTGALYIEHDLIPSCRRPL